MLLGVVFVANTNSQSLLMGQQQTRNRPEAIDRAPQQVGPAGTQQSTAAVNDDDVLHCAIVRHENVIQALTC